MFGFEILNLAVTAAEKCGTSSCVPDPCDLNAGGTLAFPISWGADAAGSI